MYITKTKQKKSQVTQVPGPTMAITGEFSFRFWPGLGLPRPKAIVVIPQNQPLPKHLRKKTSKSAKHACHYATKERPVKITMYLGLDIIIKIKFTTIFDRCAILNVLNYLTKNFES